VSLAAEQQMDFQTRIAEQVAKLPPGLKLLLDAELAAGNRIVEAELVPVNERTMLAIVLEHPFNSPESSAPAGTIYREIAEKDRRIFEFVTSDELFSLATVKFKPMILPKSPEGPPNPTEAHIARMEEIAMREEAAAAARLAGIRQPTVPDRDPKLGDAANRFIESMKMTFDMWHDGTGYDLNALREVSPSELQGIEAILIHHQPRDWRDIEALALIDSAPAQKAIEEALKSSNPQVRREAMRHVPEKADPADRERLLLHGLATAKAFDGLTEALDEAAEFHPPAVIDALLRGALNRDGDVAVHFAAMLFYLHGKTTQPFDWNQRPFFLRFNTSDRAERKMVFQEMCEAIDVDPEKYL
jgi:hypothetical protein